MFRRYLDRQPEGVTPARAELGEGVRAEKGVSFTTCHLALFLQILRDRLVHLLSTCLALWCWTRFFFSGRLARSVFFFWGGGWPGGG